MSYEMLKVIGSGAHAIVHLARDATTGEMYAIKEFMGGGRAAQLFFRELASLTALQHPNIVRCVDLIYGQGNTRNKLVLEYASGGSLRDVLNQQTSLPMEEVIHVIQDVATGLAYAHSQQILHRDLKPENILVFPDPTTGVNCYKIADLGIANHLANIFDQQKPNGSPAYMAPEQFYDFSTYASDLYSLGVIFYELLTGDRPFHGLPEELFAKHAKQPPDLSRIPELVRPIVAALLQKIPGERMKSAQSLLEALDVLPLHLASGAAPDTSAPNVLIRAPSASRDTPGTSKVLEQTQQLKLWFTVELAGSERLFVLNPSQRSAVYIVDARTTGFLQLDDRRRFIPYFLPERITATAVPYAEATTSYFATNHSLYALTASDTSPRRLFSLPFSVTSLAVTPAETLFILANDTRLSGYSPEGRQCWEVELCNYLQSPQLLVLGDNDILVTSGPIHPKVTCLDASGRIKYQIPLSSPALALMPSAVGGDFHTVLFGDGNQQPMRLATFAHDRKLAEMDLGEAVYATKNHVHFVTFFHASGKVSLISDGLPIAEYQPRGMILDDAWVPAAHAYVNLERQSPRTLVNVFRLTTTPC
ncbi:MAG: serine/threonine-protein kinase [Acidobacteriota bacterium]